MRILLFLVFILAILIFLAVFNDKLNLKSKISILALCSAILFVGFLYNEMDNQRSIDINELLYKFNSKEIIKCGDYNVTSAKFNYEFGTSSFVSKEQNGIIIPKRDKTRFCPQLSLPAALLLQIRRFY